MRQRRNRGARAPHIPRAVRVTAPRFTPGALRRHPRGPKGRLIPALSAAKRLTPKRAVHEPPLQQRDMLQHEMKCHQRRTLGGGMNPAPTSLRPGLVAYLAG